MEMKLQNRVLTKDEIQKVIAYHRQRRRFRRLATCRNFMVFRLSCCCGLRRKEIAGLNLGDFFVDSDMPFIRIRKETTKGYRCRKTGELIRKARKVSLRVDQQTREDLVHWLRIRMAQSGGNLSAPFVCGQQQRNRGTRLRLNQVAKLWQTTLLCLGRDRARSMSVHSGRHTCCSLLLHHGYSLVFVRDFAGHRNIATTSLYLHAYENEELLQNAFSFSQKLTLRDALIALALEAGELKRNVAADLLGVTESSVDRIRGELLSEARDIAIKCQRGSLVA